MAELVLADDSPSTHKVIELSFSGEEINVHYFTEGESALAHLQEKPVDVLLADASLPGLDGYELCRLLKNDAETSNVPVILLVGALDEFDPERAGQARCDHHLAKPLQTSELVELVQSLLSVRRSVNNQISAQETRVPAKGSQSQRSEGMIFDLNLSQCRATPPDYPREVSLPVFSSQEPSASEGGSEGGLSPRPASDLLDPHEVTLFVDELLESLEKDLREILPQLVDRVLGRRGQR